MSELIVRMADLVEAEGRSIRGVLREEGRQLRDRVGRLSIGLVLLAGAAALTLVGGGLIVATVYTALEPEVGEVWALLAAGVFSLGSGGALIWLFRRVQAS